MHGFDGIDPLKKTLDNLGKLWVNSSKETSNVESEVKSIYSPIEKLIAHDKILNDSIKSPKKTLGEKWREYF